MNEIDGSSSGGEVSSSSGSTGTSTSGGETSSSTGGSEVSSGTSSTEVSSGTGGIEVSSSVEGGASGTLDTGQGAGGLFSELGDFGNGSTGLSETGNLKETGNSSQEFAVAKHQETKENNIENYGMYMSETQKARLESDATKENVNVMTAEAYINRFPGAKLEVIGHCDEKGNIYMKDISRANVNHTITHETMHLSSDRAVIYTETGEKVVISGLRESLVSKEGKLVFDSNRGINEGVTEMYTLKELLSRGDVEAAEAVNAYSASRQWAQRMEALVGEERFAGAYFGSDKDSLKSEFIRLNDGKASSWNEFTKDIDTLQYGKNPEEREQAQERLNAMYATMLTNKLNEHRGD